MLASFLDHSLAPNMKGTCSFKMLVDFHQITQCCIPEGRTLDNHH
jgi:hypothetical protein